MQTPFLANFADLSRRLQPAAAELRARCRRSTARCAPAFRRSGAPPSCPTQLEQLFGAVEDLGENPMTLLALRDLRTAAEIARPAVRFVAPYQTVCNYLNYFFTPLGPISRRPCRAARPSASSRSCCSGPGQQPGHHGILPAGGHARRSARGADQALHKQPNSPAVDSKGRADCQAGQTGYLNRLVTDGRYPPRPNEENFLGGGTHVVFDPDTPGRRGGTYKSRQLGIDGMGDVP